ncbi:MAG: formylglycine-generating enzyme family protein [Planctomycetaceae bacterium]|nr:formylglycine-generating enzyme family protein [Planctomycetaceae bacterium]
MSGDLVGKNGQFIPQQVVRRLQVPSGMENALREYFQGRAVSPLWQDGSRDDLDTDELAVEQRPLGIPQRFDEAKQENLDRIWPPARRRHQFLADLSHRRMIVSIGAGVGKSTLLHQIEYVIQKAHPKHFVLRIEMKDVPTKSLEFVHRGASSLLVDELRKKIESVKAQPTSRTRLPLLPKEDPQEQYLRTYLRAMLVRGDFTLLVDGADQIDLTTIAQQGKVLREFLGLVPNIRCIVAGRPYSIVKIWGDDSLDLGQLDPVGSRKPVWEFIRIDRYTPDQLRQYLGGKKLAAIGNLDSTEVRLPRTAGVLRTIPSPDLEKMDSDSDLYWYSQNETIDLSLQKAKEVRNTQLTTSKILSLAAGVAFGLWTWKPTPVMYVPLSKNDDDTYGNFREHLHNIGVEQRLQRAGIPNLDVALADLSGLDIDPLRMAVYRDRDDPDGLEFADATIRDFYAAHWLARYLDDPGGKNSSASTWQDQRDLLLARRRGQEFERMWELLIAMPMSSIKPSHKEPSNRQSWCRAIESQFVRDNGSFGDSRLMYLAWERLLARADRLPSRKNKQLYQKHLLQRGFTREELDNHSLDEFELAMEEATVLLQRQIHDQVRSAPLVPANDAERVMMFFLTDYLDHRAGKFGQEAANVIAEDMENQWCDCKTKVGKQVRIGHRSRDDNPERWFTLDREFKLCAYQVTNRLYHLYNQHHASRIQDYFRYYGEDRDESPVTYIDWDDSQMFAIWSGCVILTEWEWEYAARAESVNADGSQPEQFWPDGEYEVKQRAWVWESSGDKLHKVGHRRGRAEAGTSKDPDTRNRFGLYDMLGNVWERQANRYGLNLVSRSVRGGSFYNLAFLASCSLRYHLHPMRALLNYGCRVARAKSRKP